MLTLAVLGDPVSHSLSPRLHAAALLAAGIDGSYVARRVNRVGLAAAVDEIRDGRLDGANVTMPHKRLAAELVDTVGSDAARAGSVNTLQRTDGSVAGVNTDIEGIRRAWGPLPDGPALILGAGGAAAASLLALDGRPLSVSARSGDAAARLLARTEIAGSIVDWGAAVVGAVVVNATPIGMGGQQLPSGLLDNASGLFDMPYGQSPTPAVLQARSLGIPVVGGVELLVAQAALSFELWTGVEASIEAMRAAVRDDHSAGSNF